MQAPRVPAAAGPGHGEEQVPRWRRSSVCEAREACPGTPAAGPGRRRRTGGIPAAPSYGCPFVTVRSGENAPQVPSGSIARIRTRWVTPASRPM
ncbi:hypothetical protein GCM10009549_17750 [Streptomyces thermoalcalitolerans]|uniref:Uncharacterized protein n=1 Tax=Streptomyces thermoalcalitolerans TaxID=65605 RepID=A0ABN1NJW5_9ACTN